MIHYAHSVRIQRQRGGALLVMLVILVIGITTAFVTSLSSTAINNKRNQTTADALAQAKEALIGFAVTYGDDPDHVGETDGYLPCPDMDGTAGGTPYEGVSETCGNAGENTLGRLPWKTLNCCRYSTGRRNASGTSCRVTTRTIQSLALS